jgi:hypothetical protein
MPRPLRPSCSTNAKETVLSWGRGRFKKSVTLDKDKNVAVMMTKSGCRKFAAFAATVKSLEPEMYCLAASGAPEVETAATVTDEEKEEE